MTRHPHPALPALRRLLAALVAAAVAGGCAVASATAVGAVLLPDPVPAASSSAGAFYPVVTTRLLGAAGAASGRALPAGTPVRVPVLGRPGLPTTGVSAVVLNVTTSATGPRDALLSIRPGRGALATARPLTSLTAPGGGTRTSLVTVPLDPEGAVDVTASAAAQVTLDLVGLYAADDTVVAALGTSGGYQPSDPVRLLGPGAGTARTPGPTVDPALAGALPAGGERRLGVDLGADTSPHVTALLLRVSVVAAAAAGAVTVVADTGAEARVDATGPGSAPTAPGAVDPTPAPGPAAAVSTPALSLTRGVTASNLVVVPAVLDDEGLLRLVVSSSLPLDVPVVVDLVGFYDDGGLGADLRFRALPVGRVLDTRTGTDAGPLTSDGRVVRAPDDVVGDNTFALVGSLTAVTTTGRPAVVTARGDDAKSPGSPGSPGSVPVAGGDQATTPVQAEVGASGGLLLSASGGPSEAVLDVVGSLEAYPAVDDPALRTWVPAVPSWQVRALAR